MPRCRQETSIALASSGVGSHFGVVKGLWARVMPPDGCQSAGFWGAQEGVPPHALHDARVVLVSPECPRGHGTLAEDWPFDSSCANLAVPVWRTESRMLPQRTGHRLGTLRTSRAAASRAGLTDG